MSRTKRSGLSLVEVLILIAILAILLGLILPATRRVREPAARSACQNNLKQLMVALHNYEATEHRFPFGCIGPGATPEERLSWMVALLPYLEQDQLAKQIAFEKSYAGNIPACQTLVKTFLCPSGNVNPFDPITHYIAMAGLGRDAASRPAGAPGNGFMGNERITRFATISDADGAANTIALAETRTDLGPWAQGGGSTLRGFDPASTPLPFDGHKKLFQVAMADGSVRSISLRISPDSLAAAITIAGGEPLTDLE